MSDATQISEVAPDIFRISTYVPQANLQFAQFLVRDDEPLLFHTGMKVLFPAVRAAVGKLIDPASLRWISFSHFEADECGALNEWLAAAPRAEPVCSFIAANVNIQDYTGRAARVLGDEESLETGSHRFRYLATPQVPHAWDAGLLFDETHRALFCSDLFHQNGDVEPLASQDLVGRFQAALREYAQGPLAGYVPWTPQTRATLERLASLQPATLLPMHGSSWHGDGAQAIRAMGTMLARELDPPR